MLPERFSRNGRPVSFQLTERRPACRLPPLTEQTERYSSVQFFPQWQSVVYPVMT